jgi:DNA-directed RNA polymerase specialized sigma24 family protein
MDDEALLDIMRSSPRASERRAAACELLVSRHQGPVWSCVRRYRNGPEPTEDLMQVGYVGLLKAIGNSRRPPGRAPSKVDDIDVFEVTRRSPRRP